MSGIGEAGPVEGLPFDMTPQASYTLDGLTREKVGALIEREQGQYADYDKDSIMSLYRQGPISLLSNMFNMLKDNGYSLATGGTAREYLDGDVKRNLYYGSKEGIGLKHIAEHRQIAIPMCDGTYQRVKSAKVIPIAKYVTDEGTVDYKQLEEHEIKKLGEIGEDDPYWSNLILEITYNNEQGVEQTSQINHFDMVPHITPNKETGDDEFFLLPGFGHMIHTDGEIGYPGVHMYVDNGLAYDTRRTILPGDRHGTGESIKNESHLDAGIVSDLIDPETGKNVVLYLQSHPSPRESGGRTTKIQNLKDEVFDRYTRV